MMKIGRFNRKGARGAIAAAALLGACVQGMAAPEDGSAGVEAAAAAPFQAKLEASVRGLAALRDGIAAEKIPLAEALAEAEAALAAARQGNEESRRRLDKLALDVGGVRADVAARGQEKAYVASLLGEYGRNLETRLHVAEIEVRVPALEAARLALENDRLSDAEKFERQFAVLAESLDRIEALLGGMRFEGRAAGPDGIVKPGRFAFLGPIAYFRSQDGELAGVAEQRLGSLEPSVVAFQVPAMAALTARLVERGAGDAPVDGSLGNARKIEETSETLVDHMRKGGPVMLPILAMASIVALVVLLKFAQMSLVGMPAPRKLEPLYEAIRKGEGDEARRLASEIRGPAGAMLQAGAAHLADSRELIEESMFERTLVIRHRLNRFIPVIAIGAACEPLLGLLGTVTGIINTFRMLTVFGSGDVKQLSGGISEALITTEFGLVIAIPALLCHSFLSRKAKGLLDKLEHIAISVLREVERARSQ
jgi:biopolymer transport protein ExbB